MFTTDNAVLLVIDVQGELAQQMHDKATLFKNIQGLLKAADHLEIPIICTEQVPEKIGGTIADVTEFLNNSPIIIKASFSCAHSEEFIATLKAQCRKEIIICGIETHVCIYQTVSDLMDLKYKVQVIVDAVSSRTLENKAIALNRIQSLGGILSSTEMILTELLRTSTHKKFKNILNLMK